MTGTELFVHSLPICLVVTAAMVALEEDTVRGFFRHAVSYFITLYGGIIVFALALFAIDYLAR